MTESKPTRWGFWCVVALLLSGCGARSGGDVLPKADDVAKIEVAKYRDANWEIPPEYFAAIMDELHQSSPVEEGKWPPYVGMTITTKSGSSVGLIMWAMPDEHDYPMLWFSIPAQRVCFQCSDGSFPAMKEIIRKTRPVGRALTKP